MTRNDPKQFESATEQYTVVRGIKGGGSGKVFEAKDSSGAPVAIKILYPEHIGHDRRRRFKNELAFARRNTHPNIVTASDDGLADWAGVRAPFYVMPLYSGTLRGALRDKPPDVVLRAFGQVLDGVEAAHLQGVIHRDLKPENILVDSNSGHFLVADFGIANFQEEHLLTAVETRASERLANFLYAAPEQRIRGADVGAAADIFALGLILNEMFTAEVIQGTGFRTVSASTVTVGYLDEVIERMVRQKPTERYASIEEIKKDLIRHKNNFIAQQTLDISRNRVVPKYEPGVVTPVRLIGVDWDAGKLTLQLDRGPEQGWVRRFKQPNRGYSSLMGAEPVQFQFNGNIASVSADEHGAPVILEHFKNYLIMATEGFQEDLK